MEERREGLRIALDLVPRAGHPITAIEVRKVLPNVPPCPLLFVPFPPFPFSPTTECLTQLGDESGHARSSYNQPPSTRRGDRYRCALVDRDPQGKQCAEATTAMDLHGLAAAERRSNKANEP